MSGYPTAADLATFLTANGLTVPADLDESKYIASAIQEFERRTGFVPFFVDALTAEKALYFDAPLPSYSWLNLGCGMTSISEVKTGLGLDGTGGTVLTLGTEYLTHPENALTLGKPLLALEFLNYIGTGRRSIKVTGRVGYTTDLGNFPEVYQGILEKAAAMELVAAMQGYSTIASVKQGPIEVDYDVEAGRSKIDRWNNEFDLLVRRYKRVEL